MKKIWQKWEENSGERKNAIAEVKYALKINRIDTAGIQVNDGLYLFMNAEVIYFFFNERKLIWRTETNFTYTTFRRDPNKEGIKEYTKVKPFPELKCVPIILIQPQPHHHHYLPASSWQSRELWSKELHISRGWMIHKVLHCCNILF